MHFFLRTNALACYVLSQSALPLAHHLAGLLAAQPWVLPEAHYRGLQLARTQIFAPSRFCPADAEPFSGIGPLLARTYPKFAAHVFIGATGIAVRTLAPLLIHKSADAPVLVLDGAGKFVISLLSGHWGGGNDLTRHMATLLGAAPVITTASDITAPPTQAMTHKASPTRPALDLLLRDAGLRPIDWNRLPPMQAALLEGARLNLWDPCGAVPEHDALRRLPATAEEAAPPVSAPGQLLVAAHWKLLPSNDETLRVAVPRLFLGIGCRKNAGPTALVAAVLEHLTQHRLEPLAVTSIATVKEKLEEPALRALAEKLHVPLCGFEASTLAQCATPTPSVAAGKRFGLPPFSVCEAAALLAAEKQHAGASANLLLPKTALHRQVTLAVAILNRKIS